VGASATASHTHGGGIRETGEGFAGGKCKFQKNPKFGAKSAGKADKELIVVSDKRGVVGGESGRVYALASERHKCTLGALRVLVNLRCVCVCVCACACACACVREWVEEGWV